MKHLVHRISCAGFLVCQLITISHPGYAQAPVVDASQNFALFDEQLAVADEQSNASNTTFVDEDDYSTQYHQPLAHKDSSNHDDDEDDDDSEQDTSGLFGKVQALQHELSELRGQLEVQTHTLENLKQQQLEFYKDLDNRLRETANASNGQTAKTLSQSASDDKDAAEQQTQALNIPRGNPADEQVSYLAAYDLVKSQEYEKAILAMKGFIQRYPNGGYTANAHYWLGEVYLVKAQYPKAIAQFEAVLDKFPASSKASAASLKIGYAFAEAGQANKARTHLQSVIQNYPDTRIAKLAAERLGQLKS